MATLTAAAVAKALRQFNGNMAAVARAFDCHRSSVKRFIDNRPSLCEVRVEARETMKDMAESALYKAVLAGEGWAVCFFLKTQARDRGYTEKAEIEHKGKVTLTVEDLSDEELLALWRGEACDCEPDYTLTPYDAEAN
jgi:hypothetical protein